VPRRSPIGDGSETLDRICGEIEIYQATTGYRFGIEALLLSAFVPDGARRAVDLGTGAGVIPLVLAWFGKVESIAAVEIQPQLVQRARRSVEHNRVAEKISVIAADLRRLEGVLPAGAFDLVVSNPPYGTEGSGHVNRQAERACARHEILCTLPDVVTAARRLLAPRGLFDIVLPPARLPELLRLCEDHKLRPTRLRLVQGRPELPPKTCLLEAARGGRGKLKIEPTLILYGPNGRYTDEVQEILYPNRR
jgi:tRNA1Val (adenine37-N6)-methyltransferase